MSLISTVVDAFRRRFLQKNDRDRTELPVATLSRALINPKTNEVVFTIDETGQLVDANGDPTLLTGETAAVQRNALELIPSSAGAVIYVSKSTTATDTRTSLSAYDP